ncbi:MAG TPA: N-methyl-L-tryptophan oxidase [Candidatus Acidoferrum sp.]|nr:N-methyl-L-tryptophan oxidase [Candidatus Acidoferrum sp.]
MAESSTYDVVVIGAGVFGSWTAWHLAKRNLKVLVVDAYGAAHARASSGGETRIIRMSYATDEIYTRWSQRSRVQWKELSAACGQALFQQTGVLWLEGADDLRLRESQATIGRCGIPHEVMDNAELTKRYPQVNFDGVSGGLLEPGSGVLLARRAVQSVIEEAKKLDTEFLIAQAVTPDGSGTISKLATSRCGAFSAAQFVFACGPWLGKVFPELLGQRIFPTRQEVFFFGSPAGDARFAPPALPTWLFNNDEVYGMPDIESRGLKMARDAHGERVDPDTQSRIVSEEGAEWARKYVARRFPALKDVPIVETRVCQYENTSNGDFLIDRHPDMPNVWLAGGGSGHGFKHGPALGEYLTAQICGEGKAEPRFSLASKATHQKRVVF